MGRLRCLVFRDGETITLQSKSGKPLTRYFPDVVEVVRAVKAKTFVLDDEIVVPEGKVFSFDALLQRIHPAASRVQKLAREPPAMLFVFDLLQDADGTMLADEPLTTRRTRLEAFARKYFPKNGRIRLSPATTKLADAKKWLTRVGATLDGIIAKRRDVPYCGGDRTGLQKVKKLPLGRLRGRRLPLQRRQADRRLAPARAHGDDGKLNHVGFTSSIPNEDKPDLTKKMEN